LVSLSAASGARALLTRLLAALERPTTALLADDPAEIVELARQHRLTPLLAVQAGAALPPAVLETCRRDRVLTVARNLVLAEVVEECAAALTEAGVPVIVLKGMAYDATLYGSAGVRPTSDVDLLVPRSKRRDAFATLDSLGFEPRAAAPGFDDPDYHEVAWTRASAEVDLHLGLAPFVRCAIDYDEVWALAPALTLRRTPVRVLAPAHAAVFHSLHMAIDHFGIPALYLLDLARLLPDAGAVEQAGALARRWRCHRPFVTARALAEHLLPVWRTTHPRGEIPWYAAGVVTGYGQGIAVPRPVQLVRKFAHFDGLGTAMRYLVTQGRRNAGELVERRVRHRSARARLSLRERG
jgi:hypothetical protein